MTTEWTPHEQRWSQCLGFREREPKRLQLRVALGREEGVCDVLFREDEDLITVLILVCGPESRPRAERVDCPVHIYLEDELGDRAVHDLVAGRRVTPYVPDWE